MIYNKTPLFQTLSLSTWIAVISDKLATIRSTEAYLNLYTRMYPKLSGLSR